MLQPPNSRSAAIACACSGFMSGCLTLYSPLTCLATSSESLITSTSVAPSARARSRPSRSPRYSATLLVASPMGDDASSSTSPAGVDTTAPAAAGPGLPRAPPSTWATTFTGSGVDVDRREFPGYPPAPAIALLAPPAPGRRADAPALGLAPVDDDLDVGVIRVVGAQLLVELVGQLLGNDAVDHRGRS